MVSDGVRWCRILSDDVGSLRDPPVDRHATLTPVAWIPPSSLAQDGLYLTTSSTTTTTICALELSRDDCDCSHDRGTVHDFRGDIGEGWVLALGLGLALGLWSGLGLGLECWLGFGGVRVRGGRVVAKCRTIAV